MGLKLENVVDKEVFLRGARLAQNPNNRLGIPGLTKVEKDALRLELNSSLFQQTKDLKVTILVTACAAITQLVQYLLLNLFLLFMFTDPTKRLAAIVDKCELTSLAEGTCTYPRQQAQSFWRIYRRRTMAYWKSHVSLGIHIVCPRQR